MRAVLLSSLLVLALSGCAFDNALSRLASGTLSRPAPKISREAATQKAAALLAVIPDSTAYGHDLTLLTTPGEVNAGKVPGKTGIAGLGFQAIGYSSDQPIWLVRYRNGDLEHPPYTQISYIVDAETGETRVGMTEGRALDPNENPV